MSKKKNINQSVIVSDQSVLEDTRNEFGLKNRHVSGMVSCGKFMNCGSSALRVSTFFT